MFKYIKQFLLFLVIDIFDNINIFKTVTLSGHNMFLWEMLSIGNIVDNIAYKII